MCAKSELDSEFDCIRSKMFENFWNGHDLSEHYWCVRDANDAIAILISNRIVFLFYI